MSYQEKYLKYKKKYIELKNLQNGGTLRKYRITNEQKANPDINILNLEDLTKNSTIDTLQIEYQGNYFYLKLPDNYF